MIIINVLEAVCICTLVLREVRSLSNTLLHSAQWKLISTSGLGYGFFSGYFYAVCLFGILCEGRSIIKGIM